MKKLLIATHNPAKFRDLKNYLSDSSLELFSLSDFDIHEEVEENGKTYEENSTKKALFYSKLAKLPAVADDAGLEIEALGGEPGVNSRYWVNKKGDDESIIKKMTKIAKELPDNNRNAKFVVVLTLALPNGKIWSVRTETKGIIVSKPYNSFLKGYPYRPFFYLPEINKYYIEEELTDSETKRYNQRHKAIVKLKPIIKKHVGH